MEDDLDFDRQAEGNRWRMENDRRMAEDPRCAEHEARERANEIRSCQVEGLEAEERRGSLTQVLDRP